MAIDFPNLPTNGQTVAINGITYKYDSTVGAWLIDSYTSNDYVAPAFLQANVARNHANAAFLAANSAVTDYSPAFLQANTARNHANAAFAKANTGGTVVTLDSINATRYIVFNGSTTGTLANANVSTSLTYNPSTGTLSSTLFNSTSDINKKENIVQVTDALNILYQIDGVRFTWKNNGLPSLGVIAQQIEKVLPEIVESEKSVNYNGLIAVLIEAVKELKAEIEELKKNR